MTLYILHMAIKNCENKVTNIFLSSQSLYVLYISTFQHLKISNENFSHCFMRSIKIQKTTFWKPEWGNFGFVRIFDSNCDLLQYFKCKNDCSFFWRTASMVKELKLRLFERFSAWQRVMKTLQKKYAGRSTLTFQFFSVHLFFATHQNAV